MIGLVIVSHGRLAEEFRDAMEHVMGPQEALAVIGIGPDDDVEARRNEIREACHQVDLGDGVIILTDMFGGTPSNLAISLIEERHIEVLAGVNLPILVKLAGVRDKVCLSEAVETASEAGRRHIHIASRLLEAG